MTHSPQDLSPEQRRRYARNISVPDVGTRGQQALLRSSVFVLGCGALGSVVASYLAGAGVGRIVLCDYDTVDLSNLQRQTHYAEAEAGQPKSAVLAAALRRLNSSVVIDYLNEFVTPARARQLFAGHDFIIDASDNPDTKYMVDDACSALGLPYCIAGVLGFDGQVITHIPGSARYIDFFPESAGAGYTPCSVGGILGPVAGLLASIQALEAIKFLTDTGQLLTDRLLIVDGRSLQFTQLSFQP